MSRYVQMATWDDAPHISEEEKKRIWDLAPYWEREARKTGAPFLGSGNVYRVDKTKFESTPFPLRRELAVGLRPEDPFEPDNWPRAFGMDVGWKWTAIAWFIQSPDTNVTYLYKVFKGNRMEPSQIVDAIRAEGIWIPGVIDPSAAGRSQRDGGQLIKAYRDLGVQLSAAANSVNGGIVKVTQMLESGVLRVFSDCDAWFEEYRKYRIDLSGNIVKTDDHLMDATRYFVLSGLDKMSLERTPIDEDDPYPIEYIDRLSAGSENGWMI